MTVKGLGLQTSWWSNGGSVTVHLPTNSIKPALVTGTVLVLSLGIVSQLEAAYYGLYCVEGNCWQLKWEAKERPESFTLMMVSFQLTCIFTY